MSERAAVMEEAPAGAEDRGRPERDRTADDRAADGNEPAAIEGVRVGRIVGFAPEGHAPLVTFRGQPTPAALVARTTTDVDGSHVGRQVVLLFEDGSPYRPIIVGWIRDEAPLRASDQVAVDADGRRLVVSAQERLVLQCGKASITLTREGKIVIRGAYVSNQSSGVLRISGGSVQIN